MPKRNDAGFSLLYFQGQSEWWGNGNWRHPLYVRNVLCEDNRRRTVYLSDDCQSGWISYKGKRLRGSVYVPAEGSKHETYFLASYPEGVYEQVHCGQHEYTIKDENCFLCMLKRGIYEETHGKLPDLLFMKPLDVFFNEIRS